MRFQGELTCLTVDHVVTEHHADSCASTDPSGISRMVRCNAKRAHAHAHLNQRDDPVVTRPVSSSGITGRLGGSEEGKKRWTIPKMGRQKAEPAVEMTWVWSFCGGQKFKGCVCVCMRETFLVWKLLGTAPNVHEGKLTQTKREKTPQSFKTPFCSPHGIYP